MIYTPQRMLKDMRYFSNQNPEISDIPTDVEMRIIDNSQDLITDELLKIRPEILSNYFDLTLTSATSYYIPDYIPFNYEQILMVEDYTDTQYPLSTSAANWFDRMNYYERNVWGDKVAWNIRDQYLEIPQKADISSSTLRVWYARRPVGLFYGTVAAGTTNTVTFPSSPTAGEVMQTNDYYNGMQVYCNGEVKTISDYVGSTRVATISGTWATTPTTSHTVELISPLPERLHSVIVNVAAKLVKIANDDEIAPIDIFIRDQLSNFLARLRSTQVQEPEHIMKVYRQY